MLDQAIYRIRDPAVVRALVTEHSWVTLVSDPPTGPVVSHLPVVEGLETDPVHANRSLADRMHADGVLP